MSMTKEQIMTIAKKLAKQINMLTQINEELKKVHNNF